MEMVTLFVICWVETQALLELDEKELKFLKEVEHLRDVLDAFHPGFTYPLTDEIRRLFQKNLTVHFLGTFGLIKDEL